MEGIFSKFEELPSGKKIVAVVGGALVILVLISIMSMVSTPKQNTKRSPVSQIPQVTPTGNFKGFINNNTISPSSSVAYQYNGKGYKVLYRSDWRLEKISSSNSESVRFIPESNPRGIYSPSLRIKVVDYTPDAFTKIKSDQTSTYPSENILFKNLPTEKFTGILTSKSGKSTYNTSYLLVNNNLIFFIHYFYDGSLFNASTERRMEELLSSFQFN